LYDLPTVALLPGIYQPLDVPVALHLFSLGRRGPSLTAALRQSRPEAGGQQALHGTVAQAPLHGKQEY
jgi:hypothetical protein